MDGIDNKLRVFISYSRSDCTPFADELLEALEVVGFDAFLDRHDIVGGEAWETRLDNEVSSADTIVFAISPASIDSEACQWEIRRARTRAKRIIPVVALVVDEAQIATDEGRALYTYLKSLQFINFNTPYSFGGGLRRLTETLNTDLDWIREHTRLGGMARRWDENGRTEDLSLRGAELAAAQEWMAGWKAPSPEPTELHRAYVNDSQAAEDVRNSEERARLEEVGRLQTEREADLQRFQKRIGRARLGLIALGVLALGAGGIAGGVGYYANERIDVAEAKAAAAQEDMEDLEGRLNEMSEFIEASKASAVNQIEVLQQGATRGLDVEPGTEPPPPPLPTGSGTDPEPQPRAPEPDIDYEKLRAAKIKAGWDIDVFYCAGPNAASNKKRAENAKEQLNSELDRQIYDSPNDPPQLRMNVGNVRVRELSEKINASPSYSVKNDQLRSEQSEKEQAKMLINYLDGTAGLRLQDVTSRSRTAWYLSIFMCAPPEKSK